ncbi:MAG: glycosyltransferase family 2 protein [Terriglobia bacterium]
MITTIIPTYRRSLFLRRAIRSVLAQTYPYFQVCVYDNASGDDTAAVVKEFSKADPRVKYHCHSKNTGVMKNLAYGMEQVQTPFFSFLCDDDIVLPKFYEMALRGFEEYPDAIFSSTATIQSDNKGRISGVPTLNWRPGYYRPPDGLMAFLKYQHLDLPGILFRREVKEKVGPIDEGVGMAADLDFFMRTAARFPVVVSQTPGAVFIQHGSSISSSGGFGLLWPGWLKMVRNLTEDERIPDEVRTLAGRVLTNRLKKMLFVNAGFGSLAQRNWPDALRAADVLSHHYGQNFRARLLRIATSLCRHLPPAYYLVRASFTLRRSLKRFKSKRLPEEYKAFTPQLKL